VNSSLISLVQTLKEIGDSEGPQRGHAKKDHREGTRRHAKKAISTRVIQGLRPQAAQGAACFVDGGANSFWMAVRPAAHERDDPGDCQQVFC